jgi:hypothetical protein
MFNNFFWNKFFRKLHNTKQHIQFINDEITLSNDILSEVIYNLINKFCEKNENTFIYDPSVLIQTNHSLFDGDTHFTHKGHIESFNYIYNNFICKN